MKLRNLAAGLALVVTGTVIGATTQQFASADISSGDRPVLVPIESCRLTDTRPDFNVGPRTAPLGPAETYRIDAQQTGTECTGDIPTSATAIAVNLTALNATANGFVTVWAEGDRPNGSTLNPTPGQLVFNAATTNLATDNSFRVFNNAGTVDIIIDVIGYYENHDHDDRYYTKSQADGTFISDSELNSALAETKQIQLDIPSARTSQGANYFASIGTAGMRLPENSGPGISWSFTVPDDYTVGTNMTLTILWVAVNGDCNVEILRDFETLARLGETRVIGFFSGPNESPSLGADIGSQTQLTLDGPVASMQPGDSINFGIFRAPSGTDCAGDVTVHGAVIDYT